MIEKNIPSLEDYLKNIHPDLSDKEIKDLANQMLKGAYIVTSNE